MSPKTRVVKGHTAGQGLSLHFSSGCWASVDSAMVSPREVTEPFGGKTGSLFLTIYTEIDAQRVDAQGIFSWR